MMLNDVFRQKRIKNTRQRKTVLDILDRADMPVAADEIHSLALSSAGHIDLSTVYRILDVFVEKGIVIKTGITGNNKALYEANRKKHKHYLICVDCRKMLPIENCPLKGYEELLKKSTSYDILGHRLHVYGHCPDCKK